MATAATHECLAQHLLENGLVLLHGDNQACLTTVKDPEHHGRTKAIDVKYHDVRNLIARGFITPEYVRLEYVPSDGFTKPPPRGRLEAQKRAYGVYWARNSGRQAGVLVCTSPPSSGGSSEVRA